MSHLRFPRPRSSGAGSLLRWHKYTQSNYILISASPLIIYLAIFAIFLTTAVNIAATVSNVRALEHLRPPQVKEYTYVDDDYPAQLPLPLPAVAHIVNDTPDYSLWADDEWGSVFPSPGNGFIQLGPSNRTFFLSMYHQLHCLDIIRVNFLVNASEAPRHIEHCLKYLRQTVLCNADTTLETTVSKMRADGRLDYGASGVGMVHRCRDWTAVEGWIAETQTEIAGQRPRAI